MSSSHSHLMKVTRRGRPFVKDIQDLFCTLLVSLQLESHRSFFKQYPNSFTTDEAAANLSSLKFSQSHRAADPKDPARIITTTTTTTFSMTREMARGICQHFMDAHLIENAADLTSPNFKERGVYMVTPKGTHMLERFITKNGISATHIAHIFAEQPIYVKMLHLERRSSDDDVIISKTVIDVIWRRVAGPKPNLTKLTEDELSTQLLSRWFNKPQKMEEINVEDGLIVRKVAKEDAKKSGSAAGGGGGDEYHFTALGLTNWLVDFTSCGGLDEAAELAGHLVRYGLISLVHDRGKVKENNYVANVKAGGAGGGAGAMHQEGEFRATEKAVYRITREGMITARWIEAPKPAISSPPSKPKLHSQDSAASKMSRVSASDDQHQQHMQHQHLISGNVGAAPVPAATLMMDDKHQDHAKDSHTARLKMILDEPAVRSLFREYLRANFCEENLSFWLDVQDFKRKFGTTSSAVALPTASNKNRTTGVQAMERHQQDLIAMAFVIYNTYLAPASPCELNIDHNLRAELISHMNSVTADKDSSKDGNGALMQASQVQTTMKLYERIQGYIFRLMATDSVPRFCKTERFLSVMRTLYNLPDTGDAEDINRKVANLAIGGYDEEQPNRSYLTISQAANEKLAAAERFKNTQYS